MITVYVLAGNKEEFLGFVRQAKELPLIAEPHTYKYVYAGEALRGASDKSKYIKYGTWFLRKDLSLISDVLVERRVERIA